MKKPWFTQLGWIYKPVSPMGYFVTFLPILFFCQILLAIDRRVNSVSDLLYTIVPWAILLFLFWEWLARHSSD